MWVFGEEEVAGSHLDHRDVPVQHSQGERHPVAAVWLHRGVLGRAGWDLERPEAGVTLPP